jgi:hypothetical protein
MAIFVFQKIYPTTIEEIENLDKVKFDNDGTMSDRPSVLVQRRLSTMSLPIPKPGAPVAHSHHPSQKCWGRG